MAAPEAFVQVVSMFGMKTANAIVGSAALTIGEAGAGASPALDLVEPLLELFDAVASTLVLMSVETTV